MVRTSLGTARAWGPVAAMLLAGALPLSCKSEPGGGGASEAVGGTGGSAGVSDSTGGSYGEGGNRASSSGGASGEGGKGGEGGEGGERASSGGGTTATSSTGGSTAGTNTDGGGSNMGGDSSTGTDAGGTGGTSATGGAGGGCVGCESSWGEPMKLEAGGQIAMNEAGAAVMVWVDYIDPLDIYDPNAYRVFASLYTPGEGWGAGEELGLGIRRYAAIDDEGNALVIWDNQPVLNAYNELTVLSISAKRYVVGVGWEATELVNPDRTDIGFLSDVAMAADGSALVVWTESVADDEWPILSSYYQPGEGWGNAVPVGVGTQPLELQVALNSSGDALAIWRQEEIDDGSGPQEENVWASHGAAGSEWTTPEAIQGETSRQSYYEYMLPDVAIDPEGNGIAVWNQLERVWTNRFDAAGGWEGAELLSTSSNDAGHASVHMDADGNALAVWTRETYNDCEIWSRRYTLESGWGDDERVSPEGEDCSHYFYEFWVAVGAAGDAVVLWQDNFRGYHWTHRYTPGLGWGGAEVFGDDRMSFRSVAMDGDGNAMVVWIDYDYYKYYNYEYYYYEYEHAILYNISPGPQ